MYTVHRIEEILRAEQASGDLLTSGELMQRAAAGVRDVVLAELGPQPRGRGVLIAAGAGNNGGDALWAGAGLAGEGVRVVAWRTGSAVHQAGWAAFLAAGGVETDAVGALELLGEVDLVLDGVLGIGGRGGLRGPATVFAQACADTGTPVVAVDLPSGLEGDSGARFASFTARTTVTFGARKACHVVQPAAAACGRVRVIDIGLDLGEPWLTGWEEADVAVHYPFPGATADKYSRGAVGIDSGSATYPGAAVLSCLGAVYGGAGFVRYLGGARDAVVAALPNIVTAPGPVQAWLLGCGWGDRGDGRETVAACLTHGLPTVIDADAIGMLPRLPLREDVVLTPHPGELARLLGVDRAAVEQAPHLHAAAAAQVTGATVLLKGGTQVVARPDGRVTLAVPGPAWTAQAGSGDTLAGICAALLAAGLGAAEAALTGASLQAMTAARHPGPRPPQDLVRLLADLPPLLEVNTGDWPVRRAGG